jgi:hypothetical protein
MAFMLAGRLTVMVAIPSLVSTISVVVVTGFTLPLSQFAIHSLINIDRCHHLKVLHRLNRQHAGFNPHIGLQFLQALQDDLFIFRKLMGTDLKGDTAFVVGMFQVVQKAGQRQAAMAGDQMFAVKAIIREMDIAYPT